MIVDKPMLGAPTFILIGGTLTLSMLDIGFQLTKSYGFFAALCSILLGNILLTCIAFPVARIAFATGLNTVELTTRIFGNKNGKYLFSIIMAALMICWAAIQLDFISVNLKLIVTQYTNYSINPIFFSIIFGILTMSFVLYGISKLNTLSKILLIPIIAIFLLFIKMSSAIQGNFSFYFPELSIVIAVMFGLFIDLPTFLCIVPSWKEAKKILIGTFLVGASFIEILGALYATSNQALTLHDYLFTGKIGWSLSIMMCLIIAGFMANIGNNYSAGICLKTLFPSCSFTTCVIAAGIMGIVLACVGPSQHMYLLLEIMGVVMASISIGTVSWWLAGPPSKYTLIAWFLGMGIGFGSLAGLWVLTTDAMLDTAIVSGIAYCILNVLSRRYDVDHQR